MGRLPSKAVGEPQGNLQMVPGGMDPHTEDRIVFLTGTVCEDSIMAAVREIFTYAKQSAEKPIYLVINTYGGFVHDMFSLYDAIKFVKAPIHTVGMGKIMSAGVLLLASGKKGERAIGRHTTVMIHPVSSGTYGTVFEQEQELKETKRLQSTMVECLANEAGKTVDEINQIMKKGHDVFLTAQEAIELGLADKIMGDGNTI